MRKNIKNYHKNFLKLLDSVRVTDNCARKLDFACGIEAACDLIKRQSKMGGKVFLIGNGGSAAIANHMAIDFWKNARVDAMSFSDSSLLTCISNDFGYENVFAKPIEFFARKNDVLVAISSSGRSKNIINGVRTMMSKGSRVITLSGFDKNNPLCAQGNYNFYVSSHKYGLVEVIHQYICHFILDALICMRENR